LRGGILIDFLRRTIRYFLFIGICLFAIVFELIKSETIRWPLIGGYLIVIAVSIYGIRVRSQRRGEEDGTDV
jgi:hypothetical protein